VEPILVPAHQVITIAAAGTMAGFHLTVADSLAPFAASLDGAIQLRTPGESPETLRFTLERAELIPAPGAIDIDADPRNVGDIFARLRIEGLSFERMEKIREQEQAVDRRVSTVTGGQLNLSELSGTAHSLSPGEDLSFGEFSGSITSLMVDSTG
jgi:hypothetical protein